MNNKQVPVKKIPCLWSARVKKDKSILRNLLNFKNLLNYFTVA